MKSINRLIVPSEHIVLYNRNEGLRIVKIVMSQMIVHEMSHHNR